jgi:hypothetical protein
MLSVPFSCARAHTRVEVRVVREHRLAVLGRPARDPGAERERLVGQHRFRIGADREHRGERPCGDVGLVEGEAVVRHELVQRPCHPLQELVQRLLGEHLVEDVGELAVRLDDGGVVRDRAVRAVAARARAVEARLGRGGVGRRAHRASASHRPAPSPA